jgi:hypothetical protein
MKILKHCYNCQRVLHRQNKTGGCLKCPRTLAWRQQQSISKLGENNPNWVGDKVKLAGLHDWVKRRLIKPSLCQDCKKFPPQDLANISQEYKRELNDWEWLCRKCHMTKDGRLERLAKIAELKLGTKRPESFKQKLREWRLTHKNPKLGTHLSPETKLKISLAQKRYHQLLKSKFGKRLAA